MDLNIRLGQGTALSQQLNLAPQLLNWLRLLQCPTTDLSNLVVRELESNPALETDDPPAPDADTNWDQPSGSETQAADADLDAKMEFLSQIETEWRYDQRNSDYVNGSSTQEKEEKHQFVMDSIIATNSLQEHLLQQVATLSLEDEDIMLAQFIVGSIDERGYLASPVEELATETGTRLEDLERVLAHVQHLDPAGIGARDLAECLLLQMDSGAEENHLPARIIRDHVDDLATQDYQRIAECLGVAENDVLDAMDFIRTLDPTPGTLFTNKPVEYVTPDVTIRLDDGELVIEMEDTHVPRLKISATCKSLLSRKQLSTEDRAYVREKMRTANFLIQGISQRQETLRKVTAEIVRVQRLYLESEEGQLKPLTMAKVASVIGVHETTVSRALANKHIDTPRGVFEMKHFFRSGYLCSDGTAMTPDAVKAQIKQLIAAEIPTSPLTDLDIVERLKERGLHLARRTIAKYRDEVGIPASKERKRTAKRLTQVVRISEPIPFSRGQQPARRLARPVLARTA